MAEEWKRAEILLEEIRKDVKIVAEGHSILLRKIDTGIGGLRKEFGEQFSDIKNTLNEHSKILNEHSKILNEHSNTLNEHSKILNEHSKILNEHSKILNEHSNTLNEHGNSLNEIKQDIKGHIRQAAPPAHVSV